jgi:hypothetical protein
VPQRPGLLATIVLENSVNYRNVVSADTVTSVAYRGLRVVVPSASPGIHAQPARNARPIVTRHHEEARLPAVSRSIPGAG